MLFEPVFGEPLVELGPGRLRQCFVGGVPAQEMAETESLLAGEQRRIRTDELLAHERGQAGRSSVSSGMSACTAP